MFKLLLALLIAVPSYAYEDEVSRSDSSKVSAGKTITISHAHLDTASIKDSLQVLPTGLFKAGGITAKASTTEISNATTITGTASFTAGGLTVLPSTTTISTPLTATGLLSLTGNPATLGNALTITSGAFTVYSTPVTITGAGIATDSLYSVDLDVTGTADFTGATVTGLTLTSPGIDDNADATAITISVDEEVVMSDDDQTVRAHGLTIYNTDALSTNHLVYVYDATSSGTHNKNLVQSLYEYSAGTGSAIYGDSRATANTSYGVYGTSNATNGHVYDDTGAYGVGGLSGHFTEFGAKAIGWKDSVYVAPAETKDLDDSDNAVSTGSLITFFSGEIIIARVQAGNTFWVKRWEFAGARHHTVTSLLSTVAGKDSLRVGTPNVGSADIGVSLEESGSTIGVRITNNHGSVGTRLYICRRYYWRDWRSDEL